MSTLQVDRIIPYQSSSVTVEGLSAPNLATTGSNTFVGNQNIQGTITASIQEGFALVGGVGNVSTLVATSSFGGGGSGFPFTGAAQITGSLGVSGATTIGGELSVTPALLPNGFPAGLGQFIIPFLSGSTNVIARDSDNALYWQPAFNVLAVSSSTANSTISPGGMSLTSGTTGSTTLATTRITSNFGAGRNITIAGDAESTALTGLTGITNPSIILQSGSAGLPPQYYAPIQFQASQSFTDGRVTITRPLIAQQGAQITGVATQTFNAPATNTQNDVVVVNGASIDGQAYTNVFFGMQDYPGGGDQYKDAWVFDYWTDFNYATGSEFIVSPKRIGGLMVLSGSASAIGISQLRDLAGKTFLNQYANIINIGSFASATTDLIYIGHDALPVLRISSLKNEITGSTIISGSNGLQVTGSVGISDVLQLAQKDPLPTGAVGQLAVSASNLYYHNGSSWTQIN
jgi:hypothetical protein